MTNAIKMPELLGPPPTYVNLMGTRLLVAIPRDAKMYSKEDWGQKKDGVSGNNTGSALVSTSDE